MSLRTRSHEKELLDGDNIPFGDLLINLSELNTIGELLGGHNVTRRGIDFFLKKVPRTQTLTIAEIGCGGGDNLFAIRKYLGKKRKTARLTGIDIKADCIKYAQVAIPDIEWICSDYRDVQWPGDKPDIIFSSLFCHHFSNEELISQIIWLRDNSKVGFFINDLHRHPLAYHSISVLTKLFSKSYLVKNDAPLSVKRSFKKNDWAEILSGAGITRYGIKWHWAFRFLICVHNER